VNYERTTIFKNGIKSVMGFTTVGSVRNPLIRGPTTRPTEIPKKMKDVPSEMLRSFEISVMIVFVTFKVPSVSPCTKRITRLR